MKTSRSASLVPALARGLEIMRLLAAEGPLAMEAVATRLSLPRSSTFRLLETLRALGCAERDAARRYRLLWSLDSGEGSSASFAARLASHMERLAESLGSTVEWYEPAAPGMELRQQRHPVHAEVRVMARPGFVRRWNTEFDAVSRVGHAFAPQAPALAPGLTHFRRDGISARLPLREARNLLAAVRKTRAASDTAFNTNGVRRFAAAVVLPGGGFAGSLSVASALSFSPSAPTPAAIVSALRAACADLSR